MTVQPDRLRAQRVQRWKEAATRYAARTPARAAAAEKLRAHRDADDPERVLAYARREAEKPTSTPGFRALVRRAMEAPGGAQEKVLVLERRIGPTLDWSISPSGASAAAAGRSVGRICSSPDPHDGAGFATGFLVSPSLLLTNHHVFGEGQDAEGTFVQFGYEVRDGAVQAGVFFEIAPELFFASNGELDFALVAVKPISLDQSARLADFQPNRLIAETGKILVGHRISIIQHPDGGTKRYAERENKLLDVLDDFLQYTTDTMPGSSGSPCFNDAWEVVALHHSGIPRMVDGEIVRAGGGVWDPSMGDDEIDWIANEGVRASRLVAEIGRTSWDGQRKVLVDELLEGKEPEPRARAAAAHAPSALATRTPSSSGGALPLSRSAPRPLAQESHTGPVIHVHGSASFTIQCPPPGEAPAAAPNDAHDAAVLEKKLRFDPDYAEREGYTESFLGVEIPLPGVSAARRSEMVKGPGNRILVLRYHHFSLAMNQPRRLQMWSAVNVDYSEGARRHAKKREAFGTDTWTLDPRLPAALQIQDDQFYKPATAVDRGHVVRRDDNCWGGTFRETEYANADTFHWTNCTPQHERFNQSRLSGLWGGLEDVIKERAQETIERMSIFAGPVLAADDPDAWGIQYPVRFWKVVAAIVDGTLEAYGFVLDQSGVIEHFGLEEIDFGTFTVHQHPIAEIEEQSGVTFPAVLRNADALLGREAVPVESPESVVRRQR